MSLHKNIFIAFFTACVLFTELSAKGTFSFSGIPEEVKISDFKGKWLVLETGSATCSMYTKNIPDMKSM